MKTEVTFQTMKLGAAEMKILVEALTFYIGELENMQEDREWIGHWEAYKAGKKEVEAIAKLQNKIRGWLK